VRVEPPVCERDARPHRHAAIDRAGMLLARYRGMAEPLRKDCLVHFDCRDGAPT